MDMELLKSSVAEEDAIEVDDYYNNETLNFEGERCGICMDVVIDRGVLDFCQHWYLKSGPGNLEKDVERRFSYALSREDIENAVLGGA